MTSPSRVIATWFYENSVEEGGHYAQVRGDSSSEQFRDVYRRCIGVFFASARRANPDARLLLYLNTPWVTSRSADAEDVGRVLAWLDVEQIVVPYSHMPPESWSKAWRNQFFVLDVVEDLVQRCDPADLAVVLDSDIVWASKDSATSMWQRIFIDELLTYDVGYSPEHVVNGLSREMLTRPGEEIGIARQGGVAISYMGGEFIGARVDRLCDLHRACDEYWAKLMHRHADDSHLLFEEAHLLSLAYARLGVKVGNANSFVRRIWTQPLKPKNARLSDCDLALWHVPAEKNYGLRRLFYQHVAHGHAVSFIEMAQEPFSQTVPLMLGIPRNGVAKIIADLCAAGWGRITRRTRV